MNKADEDKTPIDHELARVARECRAVAHEMRALNNPEITAALITYRAAQLIADRLDELIMTVRNR